MSETTKLTDFEIDVLKMLDGQTTLPWGAAVSVALEFLSERGLATKDLPYRITGAGRAALKEGAEK